MIRKKNYLSVLAFCANFLLLSDTLAQSADYAFILPFQAGDGFIGGRGSPYPFTITARLSPMFGFGGENTFRIGATISTLYTNPGVSIAAGPRIQFQVYDYKLIAFPVFRIHLGLEFLAGTQNMLLGGGDFIFDVSVLQLRFSDAYDFKHKQTYPMISIGVELLQWICPKPNTDLKQLPDPVTPAQATYADSVVIRVRSRTLALFINTDVLSKFTAFATRADLENFTVAELKNSLANSGFSQFIPTIDESLKIFSSVHQEKETVHGIITGWRQAASLTH